MYHTRAPKHFLLCPLFPFRTLGSSLEPGVDVRGWQSCCSHTKALAGKVQESSCMVNVDIYCQRQLVFLIHLYLPISSSLSLSAAFSTNPFGLIYCFHLPTDPNVPHGIPSLCSVDIFVSSLPLQHPLLLLCCPLSVPIPSWFQIW